MQLFESSAGINLEHSKVRFFGRSLDSMVREGLSGKVLQMPQEAQKKVRETLSKMVNEGDGGMICILL